MQLALALERRSQSAAQLKKYLLAATLARMHRAWTPSFHGSQAVRRSSVLLLGLVLCFWLVAFATHIHTDNDESSSSEPRSACSFCLSLPTGAPSPALAPDVQVVFVATDTLVQVVAALVALDVPSFYLSRGPPAL